MLRGDFGKSKIVIFIISVDVRSSHSFSPCLLVLLHKVCDIRDYEFLRTTWYNRPPQHNHSTPVMHFFLEYNRSMILSSGNLEASPGTDDQVATLCIPLGEVGQNY